MRHAAMLGRIEFAGRRGRGRRLWTLAEAMAAVLVLAGLLMVAKERAGAQSNVTLVSNEGRGSQSNLVAGSGFSNNHEVAGDFTTGTTDGSYVLTSERLRLRSNVLLGNSPVMDVTVHSDGAGAPSKELFTLFNPSNLSSISTTYAKESLTSEATAAVVMGGL